MSDKDSADKQPWLVPIVLAVITTIGAVAVAWINAPKQPDSQKIPPTSSTPPSSQETPTILTENWAGEWICRTDGHYMYLTITGKGSSSSLKGYYPPEFAYGNRPATEEYTIKNTFDSNASGEYIYHDKNPNGYQGRPGEWEGRWSIKLEGQAMSLTRNDYANSWRGDYKCTRR